MSELYQRWIPQMRKGLLELCVLTALTDGERYGYELVKSLLAIPGLGVSEGTLYPLLSRLRLQGLVETRLVESEKGPARKYYRLTQAGRETAEAMDAHFETLIKAVRSLRRKSRRST